MSIRLINERRRAPRVSLAFHVEVSGIGVNGIPYCDHAAAADVSDRGCQVHLTREVRPSDLLTVRVVRREGPAPDQERPFLYQVVWVESSENGGGWIAGLSALEPGNPWHVNSPQESLVRN